MEGVHYIANTTGELIFLLDINKYEKVYFDRYTICNNSFIIYDTYVM